MRLCYFGAPRWSRKYEAPKPRMARGKRGRRPIPAHLALVAVPGSIPRTPQQPPELVGAAEAAEDAGEAAGGSVAQEEEEVGEADGAAAAEGEHEGASNPGTPVLEPRGLPSPVDVFEGHITTPSGTPTPLLPEEKEDQSLEEMVAELMEAEEASASEPAQQVFKH